MLLSAEDEWIFAALEKKLRLNRTAVVRLAVTRLADVEGIEIPESHAEATE
jgi:hypothetical protein